MPKFALAKKPKASIVSKIIQTTDRQNSSFFYPPCGQSRAIGHDHFALVG